LNSCLSKTAGAERGLTPLFIRPAIGRDDVRQFMQTCLLALTSVITIDRADLYPMLISIGVTDAMRGPAR
jgi:hypothetical protein